jgi:hypothetical protein
MDRQIEKAHILNALRDVCRETDSFGENESESISRLKEHQV